MRFLGRCADGDISIAGLPKSAMNRSTERQGQIKVTHRMCVFIGHFIFFSNRCLK